MKRVFKMSIWIFAGALSIGGLASMANAATSANPYHVIAQRNVFNLHDDPPPTNKPPPVKPPSNVKLTGISSMLGVKRAFFMVSSPPERGKPPGKEESFIMTEGEQQGIIEVLKIDEQAATVTIKNDGVEDVLALDSSPKLPSGPGNGPPQPGMANGSRIRPPALPDRPNTPYRRQSAEPDQAPVPTPAHFAQAPYRS